MEMGFSETLILILGFDVVGVDLLIFALNSMRGIPGETWVSRVLLFAWLEGFEFFDAI